MATQAQTDIPDELVDCFESFIVSNVAGGVFYGSLVIMQIVVIFMIFSREQFKSSKPRGILLIICLIMFAFSSTYFAINLARTLTRLRSWKTTVRQDPHAMKSSLQKYHELDIAQDVIYPINFFFSDAVVVWRAWVLVLSKSRVILALLLFGSACSVTLTLVQDVLPTSLQDNTPYNAAVLTPLLLTNLFATCMIGHKFWSSRNFLKPYTLDDSHQPGPGSTKRPWTDVEKIFLIMLESGFLYLVVWVFSILANVGVFGDAAADLKDAFLPHLAAIYPPMVFLLVASQKSPINAVLHDLPNEDSELTEISMVTTQFSSPRSIQEADAEDKPTVAEV
ncbi:hypothetical protein VKT23_006261 [Stygiomarasmius scandens]|uniref:Uncharacterized protein n=1 Tax=Marasmiellus scandens TaxID=2682957 RepID=A0ABR1JQL1_9AGAR